MSWTGLDGLRGFKQEASKAIVGMVAHRAVVVHEVSILMLAICQSQTLHVTLLKCSCAAVYDHQFTNSDNCVFNKLVFISW